MSFGMLGCNLHCGYCQNWLTSQAFKDPRAIVSTRSIEPQQIVESAVRAGARAVISTCDEPLITADSAAVWLLSSTASVEFTRKGFWLEVVTLIVPQLNDSDGELRDCAQFLAGVSPYIPWHLTAFHDDYKMTGRGGTPSSALRRAVAIGRAGGLRYVYAGNAPGSMVLRIPSVPIAMACWLRAAGSA